MAINKDIQPPKKGMNRDTAPFELSKEEYSFALNANIHDEHGNGKVVLQNEPSNIKCTGFKDGFKVVGHKYFVNRDITLFWLYNPTTNVSEIGFISSFFQEQDFSPTEQVDAQGNVTVVLETPLELQQQVAVCTYTTLISDYCDLTETATGCLGFSLDFPIKEQHIHIKEEKTGVQVYFTDFKNPQRYLQLDNIKTYYEDKDDCTGEITQTCFQCEKLRVFPLFDKPCLKPEIIQNGGNLKAGTYEVLIAYCDLKGSALTDYYAITNPIPVYDKNNRILDQTLLDYITNQAIGINVIDIDESFEYYKIVVIYRSGLDGAVTVYENGVYPFDQTSVTIYTTTDKNKIDLVDVISRRPFYTKARGLAESNGYLFHYGLETKQDINLQPVISLMGGFARWMTVQAKEDLYEDGIFVANYTGYMRGEVYPFALKAIMEGGYELPIGVFVPRPPSPFEVEVLDAPGSTFVSNTNTDSILENNPECSKDLRNQRWQFEDTSTIDEGEVCLVPTDGYDTTTEVREVEDTCFINTTVALIPEGTVQYEGDEDIITYINSNIQNIIDSEGTNGQEIREILEDPSQFPDNCDPNFGENCAGVAGVISEEMFALDVDDVNTNIVGKDYEQYTEIAPPTSCDVYVNEDDGSGPQTDTTFVSNFMLPSEIVHKRLNSLGNISCLQATQINALTTPVIQNTNYFVNKGQLSIYNSLQTTTNTSTTRVDFYLHLQGSSGDADITIGVNVYQIVFNTDLTTTANDFVTTEAANILSNDNITVEADGESLHFYGDFVGFPTITITNTTVDLDATYERFMFTDKVHSNGLWYKALFNGEDGIIVQLSPNFCNYEDDNSYRKVRVSVYDSCSAITDKPVYSRIIDDVTLLNDPSKFIELLAVDFSGQVFIAIDTPIRTREVTGNTVNTLTNTCGCFSIFTRERETITEVTYTNLTFGKKQTYRTQCTFEVVVPNDCDPVPYQKGKFSYWESIEKYPCNEHLWDSSVLNIPVETIPEELREEFEEYYVESIDGNTYVLNGDANLMDKPIRHYKFPCSSKVPFMNTNDPGNFSNSTIYPIGFFLSNTVINTFLDIAVLNGLISQEDRGKIKKFEIFRGDRRVDKSIIAKGLLFDMYRYQEKLQNDQVGDNVFYPNYPLNSLGIDNFNNVPHPYGNAGNGMFTFHSPTTHFYKPSLPREIKIEGYQFGKGANYFDEVKGHPTYVVLSPIGLGAATALAGLEVGLELLLQISTVAMDAATAGTIPGTIAATAISIVQIALMIPAYFYKFGQYRLQWEETLYNLGKPNNFAYYQAVLGHYNRFLPNGIANSALRGIGAITYINDGRWELTDENSLQRFKINNLDREDSVVFTLGKEDYNIIYPDEYRLYDNRDVNIGLSSRKNYSGVGRSEQLLSNAASPYATLIQYLPGQYGTINNIEWVNTGFCGSLESSSDCDPVFGGDIFISRFSLKRKLPFFTTTAMGQAPLTPFKYSDYFNINPPATDATASEIKPRFYLDYKLNNDEDANLVDSIVGAILPSSKSEYNLDGQNTFQLSLKQLYERPPKKFYLYSYGVPYFLAESEINVNFRYAKREQHENFYPNVGDILKWTQEQNVSIREPNTYFYNTVYSQGHTFYPWRILPSNYDPEIYSKINNLKNSVIYSKQDASQNSLTNPWLLYRALDAYDFEQQFGDLISITGIESEQILARFTNGFSIFGAIDVLRDRLTPETKNLGQGGIFAGRTVNFNKTQLGYAGTQHTAMISCDYGHFWVDAKRGKVFQLNPGGQGLKEISQGSSELNSSCEKWFKENLPFKLLQYTTGLTNQDLDNNYKGVGIVLGWDDRLKRLFVTKKDYKPKENVCFSGGVFYDNDPANYTTIIAQYLANGYTFTGFDNCRLRFETNTGDGVYEVFLTARRVRIGDPEYFTDCSFTIGYNPLIGNWISYYSFKPDYYIGYNTHFQTGLNFSQDPSEIGLWSHLPFTSSYQVFYGKKYPFIIEYPLTTEIVNSVLHTIEYYLDVRKYYNKHNYTNRVGVGFNKAIIYNDHQNSGLLNLVVQEEEEIFQNLVYPQHNINSIDILQTEINNKFSFNYIYNVIRNEKAGLPIFINDTVNVEKTLDDRLLDYTYTLKDRLRGDYFLVRLINDAETRFKFLFRFGTSERNFYNQ